MQTEYIDLYQSHFDEEIIPVEETMEAYDTLVKQGKVKYVGASNLSPARLLASLEASEKNEFIRYESLQPEYNLYSRDYEMTYDAICEKNKLGVLPYFSLASGFLTGKYRSPADISKSVRGSGMAKYQNERGFNILKTLDEIATKTNMPHATIAIAWLIGQKNVTSAIASATDNIQMKQLIDAASFLLDPSDMIKLANAGY